MRLGLQCGQCICREQGKLQRTHTFRWGRRKDYQHRGLANCFSEQCPPTQEGGAFKHRMMKEKYAQFRSV